jgi:hypothetical protein
VRELLFGKNLLKVDQRHAVRLDDHDFVIDPVDFEDFQIGRFLIVPFVVSVDPIREFFVKLCRYIGGRTNVLVNYQFIGENFVVVEWHLIHHAIPEQKITHLLGLIELHIKNQQRFFTVLFFRRNFLFCLRIFRFEQNLTWLIFHHCQLGFWRPIWRLESDFPFQWLNSLMASHIKVRKNIPLVSIRVDTHTNNPLNLNQIIIPFNHIGRLASIKNADHKKPIKLA